MKVNNKFFNFDRCLKFVFSSGAVPGTLTVEYCPRKDERLCARLEAQIKDMPSPNEKDRPGYSAVLTIYNPGHDLLRTVANSCAWITDYTNSGNGESQKAQVSGGAVQRYYAHKLHVDVYAGYFDEGLKNDMGTSGDGDYGDAPLMSGVVNNTYYYRRGNDDVLVLYAHDIDFTALPKTVTNIGALVAREESTVAEFLEENEKYSKGLKTFDLTIRNLISSNELQKRAPVGESSSGRWVDVLAVERTVNADWFNVLYVRSPEAYFDFVKGNPGLRNAGEITDPNLAARLKDPMIANRMITENWYTTASDLPGMINDLCRHQGFRLGWQVDRTYANKLTYIVYMLGMSTQKYKLPGKGAIQIWNYQNLVAMPTIDGSGSMHIKMWFNRKCAPWAYIGLHFATQAGKDADGNPIPIDGTFVDPSKTGMLFNGDKLIGGIGGQAQNPAVATTQLSGSAAISGVLAGRNAIKNSGYIFNHDWLIVTTTHNLSTHGNQWTTEVHTAPLYSGYFTQDDVKSARS